MGSSSLSTGHRYVRIETAYVCYWFPKAKRYLASITNFLLPCLPFSSLFHFPRFIVPFTFQAVSENVCHVSEIAVTHKLSKWQSILPQNKPCWNQKQKAPSSSFLVSLLPVGMGREPALSMQIMIFFLALPLMFLVPSPVAAACALQYLYTCWLFTTSYPPVTSPPLAGLLVTFHHCLLLQHPPIQVFMHRRTSLNALCMNLHF